MEYTSYRVGMNMSDNDMTGTMELFLRSVLQILPIYEPTKEQLTIAWEESCYGLYLLDSEWRFNSHDENNKQHMTHWLTHRMKFMVNEEVDTFLEYWKTGYNCEAVIIDTRLPEGQQLYIF